MKITTINHNKLIKLGTLRNQDLAIFVFAPSKERKARQILLVHRNRRRRVVHATNLKPCILLVWIALLVFCFG
jgi:accessory gene regulator protein AgrB